MGGRTDLAYSRLMLLLAVLWSTWAAGGGSASAADPARRHQVTAPAGPGTPAWLEGSPRLPAAGASRKPRVVMGADGPSGALVCEALAARIGAPRAGMGVGDGTGWRDGGPLSDRARGPPRG